MKKHLTHFLVAVSILITGIITSAYADNTPTPPPSDANIIGHVVDKHTGEHIPGITIQIKGTLFGCSTDRSGHYFITHLKPGTYTLVMRGVGYLSQEKTVKVVKNKVSEVNFDAEEDVVNIDEVVVTADRHETIRRLAPVVVGLIGPKVFARTNSQNLLQGLSFQPGLRVENNCQNCGFNQVRINGLEGKYSQILIDSRPIFSALAGIYGLEQIPTNMIDRVEVVRGGGSALYGSSAIGGVINIITKNPTNNSANVVESFALTGMTKPDNNLSFDASVVSSDSRSGIIFFGAARHRTPWDANGDGFSELGKLDSRSIGARGFYKPSAHTQLTGEIHTIQEHRRGGDHFDYPDHVAEISERLDHSIYSGNLKFDLFSANLKHHVSLFSSAQNVNRESYYGGVGSWKGAGEGGKDVGVGAPLSPDKYGTNFGLTRGFTLNSGVQYTYDINHLLFMPAQLLLGFEHTYDKLFDSTPIRAWEASKDEHGNPIKDANGNYVSAFPPIDQKINIFSQIAQLEWKNEMFSILLGARVDEHSLVKTPIISPRATLRYNPTHDINLRFSYAKGFRAPQIFDEELHVGFANGEQKKIFNAPNLKPETSHAFTLSSDMYATLGDARCNFLVEGFYNKILNIFVEKETDQIVQGFRYYERENNSNAHVYGVNLEGKLVWDILQVQGGLSLVAHQYGKPIEWGSYVKTVDGTPLDKGGMPEVKDGAVVNESQTTKSMLRTPNVYGYLTAEIEPVKNFSIALNANLYGPMLVPHSIVYGGGAALSDIAAKHDADKFTSYFDGLGINADDGSRDIRIDELTKTPTMLEIGCKLSYKMSFNSNSIELNVGVNNIFNSMQKDYDKGADRDSAYIYGPLAPRTLFMGVKLSI